MFLKAISLYLGFGFIALLLHGTSSVSVGQTQSTQGNAVAQTGQNHVFLTVVDKDSRFVATLKSEDIRVLANGKPQEIIAFRKLDDQPLALAILIDASISQERTLPDQKRAADAFVQAIMRQEKDHGALVTFTGKQTVEQAFTSDLGLLRRAISRAQVVLPTGYVGSGVLVSRVPPKSSAPQLAGSTALWDAICATSGELFPPTLVNTRKAIILLSDGIDTSSRATIREAVERAVKTDVEVYAIGIGDELMGGIDKEELRKLAEQTGGRAFFPKKVKDLGEVFAQIQQVLGSRYEVSYRSLIGGAGSPAKLKIEIINPALRPKDLRIYYQRLKLPRDR